MLRSGSSGDEVTKLQRRLFAAGYEPGGPDGLFGPKTEASPVINALTAQGGPAAAAGDDGPAPL
jgi:peptidoglycan hydrolase-like protein with peptidoglycan-binding domain